VLRNVVALAFMTGIAGLSRDPGCGGADSPSSGPNAPCTRSRDCSGGLECNEGVCTDPDAGMHDGATNRPDANDGG
jgi:hypothetical protein